jgi:hypothetical protein
MLYRQTTYVTEAEQPLPPVNPPLAPPQDDPPLQAPRRKPSQRLAGGGAQNNGGFEPTDTRGASMNSIHNPLRILLISEL